MKSLLRELKFDTEAFINELLNADTNDILAICCLVIIIGCIWIIAAACGY